MSELARLHDAAIDAAATMRSLQLHGLKLLARASRSRSEHGSAPRALAHLPTFVPERLAGSEVSIAMTLAHLVGSGWEVRAIVEAPGAAGDVEGVDVRRDPPPRETLRLYRWSDVVITQLGSRNRAMRWATATGRPLVQFLHMGGVDTRRMLGRPDLLVFNAEWIRQQSEWRGPSLVVHPPIDPARYRTTPGRAITLINLSERKGWSMFVELARRCPDLQFLGVRGGWGEQLGGAELPNVTLMDQVVDMRDVYSRTAILLVPSREEPYGRVALEAACSGIPVVASPVPGILEAMGDAALYAPLDDPAAWEAHVRDLQRPERWRERSVIATGRAELRAARDELDELDVVLRSLAETGR